MFPYYIQTIYENIFTFHEEAKIIIHFYYTNRALDVNCPFDINPIYILQFILYCTMC